MTKTLTDYKARFEASLQAIDEAADPDSREAEEELNTLYNALNDAHSYIRKLEESNPRITPGA